LHTLTLARKIPQAHAGISFGVKIEAPTFIIELNGAQEIEKAGFSYKNVYACLAGERKSHLGFFVYPRIDIYRKFW
jgi:hypothetical protein